ncbi:putative regulator of sorbitol operon [Lachnospiraceae bacterium TWA4]|nr:putative regulator of sorbitol operon [Lachnospiraceae bacterium TWA4]
MPFSIKRPVIFIQEIFDADEVAHKIEKAKYWNSSDGFVLDNNWFVMSSLLDESRFFLLDSTMSYEDAIRYMVEPLVEEEQLDSGFLQRLQEREKQGSMIFGHSVAIPHAVQYSSNHLVLSIGCCESPIEYQEKEIQVIFLIGLPEHVEEDESILIRMYDEIINITQDAELLQNIAKADSFKTLLRILYRQAKNKKWRKKDAEIRCSDCHCLCITSST